MSRTTTDRPAANPARPTLAHRIEYAALRALVLGMRPLPEGAERGLFRGAAYLAHRVLGIRRELVEEHLRSAFPERSAEWVERTARASYASVAREMLAAVRLSERGPEAVIARTRVEGLDAIREALAGGRGAVLFTGHLGNWEIAGASLAARGIPLDAVFQRQNNPLMDRLISASRERMGIRVIERSRAPKLALRALRDGRAVGFVADQDAKRAGLFVPFFGRPASTHRGPAVLAYRTNAPVLVVTCVREQEDYRVRVQRVEVDREGEMDDVVHEITRATTARLEAAIRENPEQYLWLHRRWKTRPEPAERSAGEPTGPPPE